MKGGDDAFAFAGHDRERNPHAFIDHGDQVGGCHRIEDVPCPGSINAAKEDVAVQRRAKAILLRDRQVQGFDASVQHA